MSTETFGASLGLLITLLTVGGIVVTVALSIGIAFFLRRAFSNLSPMGFSTVQLAPAYAPVGGAQQIKKTTCRQCGASKVTPSKTAFLYCDYCGALVDWDFRVSITTAGSVMPGPEYERLAAHVKPIQLQARARGDHQTYRQTLYQLFDAHLRACPASYSVRLGDPAYRAALLEFMVNTELEAAFDPESEAKLQQMNQAIRAIQWYGGFGSPRRVSPPSFWALTAATLAYQDRRLELMKAHAHTHPDSPTVGILRSLAMSTYAQGWLPYLEKPDQDRLLSELGLSGEYIPVPQVQTHARHCGNCGNTASVATGAQRVVCERCGHLMDTRAAEIPCKGCGSPLSMPYGAPRFHCPHCRAEMRIDGVL
ncbi:MAG: hypothetical protein IT379_10850 [Deltaproteobacteria bacterium]|nr:hypothetical protein [Deltaproteobacteria bacterium]